LSSVNAETESSRDDHTVTIALLRFFIFKIDFENKTERKGSGAREMERAGDRKRKEVKIKKREQAVE
jgi:hypothetical protein